MKQATVSIFLHHNDIAVLVVGILPGIKRFRHAIVGDGGGVGLDLRAGVQLAVHLTFGEGIVLGKGERIVFCCARSQATEGIIIVGDAGKGIAIPLILIRGHHPVRIIYGQEGEGCRFYFAVRYGIDGVACFYREILSVILIMQAVDGNSQLFFLSKTRSDINPFKANSHARSCIFCAADKL